MKTFIHTSLMLAAALLAASLVSCASNDLNSNRTVGFYNGNAPVAPAESDLWYTNHPAGQL